MHLWVKGITVYEWNSTIVHSIGLTLLWAVLYCDLILTLNVIISDKIRGDSANLFPLSFKCCWFEKGFQPKMDSGADPDIESIADESCCWCQVFQPNIERMAKAGSQSVANVRQLSMSGEYFERWVGTFHISNTTLATLSMSSQNSWHRQCLAWATIDIGKTFDVRISNPFNLRSGH